MMVNNDKPWHLVGIVGEYAVLQREVNGNVETQYVYIGGGETPDSP